MIDEPHGARRDRTPRNITTPLRFSVEGGAIGDVAAEAGLVVQTAGHRLAIRRVDGL
jgi:hypothetical protein